MNIGRGNSHGEPGAASTISGGIAHDASASRHPAA
jgi:hypothetical protein